MTLANIITISRIVLVPVFITILLTKFPDAELIAFLLFLLASITDFFDGYVARRFNQESKMGEFLDPLADKLLVSGALIALVSMGRVETWVAAIIILREILITAFRFYYYVNRGGFRASLVAKSKTFFQIFSIAVLIIYARLPHPEVFHLIGRVTLYLALLLTVYSGVEYLFRYSRSQPEAGKGK